MVNIVREAKADVKWYCDTIDRRDFGPVYATILARDEYEDIPTEDLQEWANNALSVLLERICEDSCGVFGDSVFCGLNEIIGEPYDVKQTPPTISPAILGNIEIILRKIKENADDIDYVQELNRELDVLLERNDLTRDDISNIM